MRTPKQCFGARRGLASHTLWLACSHRPASRPSLRETKRFAVTSAGGPISCTRPWCMQITRSEALRAKLISWVTISKVMPYSARLSTTRSTSPASSGSSALVSWSHSSTAGSIANARAIATSLLREK